MMSKANKRYLRSVLMLVFAMGGLVWVAVDLFDIPLQEMRALLLSTAMVVGGIIIAAALILFLVMLLRKLFARARK